MIGSVTTGKSFRGVLNYCLHDKLELSHEQKISMQKADGLKHQDRAKILDYNMCSGNIGELIGQFRDVRNLRPQLEKPVLHVTLSMDVSDKVSEQKLRDVAKDYAKSFGFEKNQYVVILHEDTKHKHIHIVANRVGYDGKTLGDSQSYKRSAEICRTLEKQHELKQVLSPKMFLPESQRQLPREDHRKEDLKEKIREQLLKAKDFEDFRNRMETQKVRVIKGRGIAFQDEKKMYVKGSDLGYAMATIEKVLQFNLQQRLGLNQRIDLTRQKELKQSQWTDQQKEKYLLHHVLKNSSAFMSSELKTYYKNQQQIITHDPSSKRLLEELAKPKLQKEINQELCSEDYEPNQRLRQRQVSMGR
jgi:hypothetical protein